MTDDLQDALVDKFFDPVINAKSLEALRSWLRKQPTDEIEMFLAFFNFEDFEDRRTILDQELRRREERHSAVPIRIRPAVTMPFSPIAEKDVDAFHGRAEDRELEVKSRPIKTEDMVKHVQGGFNGKGSELTIVVGVEEDEDGRFDKDRKRPVTFPLSVPGQKQEFASFDKYRLHLLKAVTSTTDGYTDGMFEVHEVSVVGGSLIVVTAYQSPNRPHQNTKNGRHFIRADGETRDMTPAELQEAIAVKLGTSAAADTDSFERDFFNPGDMITDAVMLVEAPLAYLRVVPAERSKDRTPTQVRTLLSEAGIDLQPFGRWSSCHEERNEFGLLVWGSPFQKPELAISMMQVFSDGEVWGMDVAMLSVGDGNGDYIPSRKIVSQYTSTLRDIFKMLRDALRIQPPVTVVAGLDGVKDLKILLADPSIKWSEASVEEKVEVRVEVKDFGMSPQDILRPFFEAVWDACGETYSSV